MEEYFPVTQYVTPDGEITVTDPSVYRLDLVKKMYTSMQRARLFDRKAITLQRQGRIGTYAPFEGQEAAQIGSALALGEQDWLFPSYRDHAATMTFGHSLISILLYWAGRIEGCIPPQDKHIFPPSVPIATQIPHAVGTAWAEKLKGGEGASIVYFGDGATSEGDFHEGLNFASVFQLPVVFFCQNNGYAISVPVSKQMRSKTIAQKAIAYDMPGVRVDGNDALAVYQVTKEALERARKGEGPTLIEAVTWRYGAHTTADDPTKYRDQSDSEARRQFDPLDRLEKLLQRHDDWDELWAQEQSKKAEDEIQTAVMEMEDRPPADPTYMFEHVFAQAPQSLLQQKRTFEEKGV
ncbi:pyruvate dehydrogenase (acetyl-transferring) E1 component subunit alpha [Bacillus horti]|uniref:pyruvate dehydrogenase (acetyl-transferring) E1 component subunit alpha n=1 Tax=Caldalkalibacillus horti TaxID=77523 RepID=UPI00352021C2